ncbi:hypothetical protein CDD82_4212 [Ophiocordyceps australis]|uniref:Peptidase A1 domain-containing protein n=1 Tax=Ophiocordyceps australis TaxID=1399860 RepID=A0A2C5XL55_9HYPO|nr:hypothetical protein CDD82_4212 [Ophiocordyceps australis]
MKAVLLSLALASLAESAALSTAPSSPSDNQQPGNKAFTLEQITNSGYKGHDALAAFLKAYMKYGKGLPADLQRALDSNKVLKQKYQSLLLQKTDGPQKGTAQALPAAMYDSEYVVPVQVGTPPQTIPLNLDTGSSDLWTFSTDTNAQSVNGQTLYKPKDSTTSKLQSNESWQIMYGDGAGASGIVYKDRVSIGNTSVESQAVESAVQVSQSLTADQFSSGILGLANSAANTVRPNHEKTYIDNISGDLAQPLFTANLQKGRPGNYNFGYINDAEYNKPIQYAQLDPRSPFWRITVSGYQVANLSYKESAWNAIVDTGTSLILAPKDIVQDYYSKVDGSRLDPQQGVVVFPCKNPTPDFIFGISTYRGRVPGSYMNYGNFNETHCYGGIQSSEGLGFAVLGDVLLKAQFVVFDYGQARVGFANKKTD